MQMLTEGILLGLLLALAVYHGYWLKQAQKVCKAYEAQGMQLKRSLVVAQQLAATCTSQDETIEYCTDLLDRAADALQDSEAEDRNNSLAMEIRASIRTASIH